ncbi:hypothetical protein CRYUN_Cryun20dG0017000 [Craigia yunnanensis]
MIDNPFLQSVLELHQNQTVGDAPKENSKKLDDLSSAVGDAPKKNSKKFDHLVLGPASGEGLPNRFQCQDYIAFFTVFTIYNNSPDTLVNSRSSNLFTVGNASFSKSDRSMAILNVFINLILVRMPRSNVIILTDPESDLSVQRNRVTTFLEIRLEKLSQERGRITHFIFTDSDIAVIDDLGQIFEKYQNFHLALTFRNNKDQPLNYGFIAVRGQNFFYKVLEVYSSRYMNASRMLGDQLALAWVIKSHLSFDANGFSKAQAFIKEIGGASVLFLPCATYNWTPPEGAGQFHGMPLDVKVHFKGSRKRLMLEAWNFFSSSADISDMLCLILKSGRTKYDF